MAKKNGIEETVKRGILITADDAKLLDKLKAKLEANAGGAPLTRAGVARAAIRSFAKQQGVSL